jgi:hypothetical protein
MKITIEDVINEIFTEDKLKKALDFAVHLRTLGLPIKDIPSLMLMKSLRKPLGKECGIAVIAAAEARSGNARRF